MTTAVALPLIAQSQRPSDDRDPYVAYSYSYPHKSAYGPLDPTVPLTPLWQAEQRDGLFLYLHVPFCEMRCGFCNLFARAGGDDQLLDAYLDALERQARVLAEATAGGRRIARLAVGGGTPTYLSAAQLDRLFQVVERYFLVCPAAVPTSVEVSPRTATADRLHILRNWGVDRVSLGVQSFFDGEAHAIGRPQHAAEVHAALELVRAFPTLNIDLIYGQPGQTITSWLDSIRQALAYRPEEIYLYPLYVRPGTGIGRRGDIKRSPAEFTRLLYRAGRALLLSAGYHQNSMRFFQAKRTRLPEEPVYCCQTDGMLGLGCGARSYASGLHYSSRFAVEATGVHAIVNEWIAGTDRDFSSAAWGCRLTDDDRRRRYVLQSLLTRTGLAENDYARVFGVSLTDTLPGLEHFVADGFVERLAGVWHLTARGFEFSDWIGPALYSPTHRARLERFVQA